MSYIWTFAPESKALLQRCLTAASPPDESNKWIQKFGVVNFDLTKTKDIIVVNDSPDTDDNPATDKNEDANITNAIEEFLDPEIDLIQKFDYFIEKCRKCPNLLMKLAENLPTNTAEKLFEHILNTEDLNKDFLTYFYQYFFHSYVKRENSRFCTDILLQIQKKYPIYLKVALTAILKDLEIQNNVVNDFILHLNANDQTNLLVTLSDIEFTPEEFSHNLFNIHTAYKTCDKTETIQKYIFNCLKNYTDFCSSDKNYGKLMLSYLQYVNSIKENIDCIVFEELIEKHKSPFKRPCLSVLQEIKDCK